MVDGRLLRISGGDAAQMGIANERDVVEGVQKWIGREDTHERPKTDAGPPVIYALARAPADPSAWAGFGSVAATNDSRSSSLLRLRVYTPNPHPSPSENNTAGLTNCPSLPLIGNVLA